MHPFCRALEIPAELSDSQHFVVSFVGAGGKTSCAYALLGLLRDHRVVFTTTTRIRDPRTEANRPQYPVFIGAHPFLSMRTGQGFPAGGCVVASGYDPGERKLLGVDPSEIDGTVGSPAPGTVILVEADGSRGLPIKAPAGHEPAVPSSSDVVVGVIGLDCVGKPLDGATAHRPELLGPLVGLEPGKPIEPIHVARLVLSPAGLFKGAPPSARLVVLLNKADSAGRRIPESIAAAIREEAALRAEGYGAASRFTALAEAAVVVASLRDGRSPDSAAAI